MKNREIQFLTPVYPEKLDGFFLEITDERVEGSQLSWTGIVSDNNGASFAVENDGLEDSKYFAFDEAGTDLLNRFGQCADEAYDFGAYDPIVEQVFNKEDVALIWIELRDLDPEEIKTIFATQVVAE
jgi:hypothetical protein